MSVVTVFLLLGIEAAASLTRRFIVIPAAVSICLLFSSIWTSLHTWEGTMSLIGWSATWFQGLVHIYTASLTHDMITLISVITILGVSSTIVLFSASYMLGDYRLYEFVSLLSLFMTSMLAFVVGASLFWSISFWEAIGICSFALISFWCMRIHAIRASVQALLVNKFGDVCIMVGAVGLINSLLGDDPWSFNLTYDALLVVCAVLVVGTMSKSALVTLHYWLPYAMEGPTSVSALIHAATLVTAGLFLLVKTKYLLLSSTTTVLLLVLSGLGLCLLAFLAIDQYDVKRLVAYSTLSQIAYMLMAIALGAPEVGVLYLLVHALFKSLMFMSCGSLIHGMYDQQDLRMFGGLSKTHMVTSTLIMYSGLTMLGIVCSMGSYSKELTVHVSGASLTLYSWAMSLVVALGLVVTTLYSSLLVLGPFVGSSSYVYHRSADDTGLFVTTVLSMQVVSLLITGLYLNHMLTFGIGVFGLSDLTIYSFESTMYLFAVIVVTTVILNRSRFKSLVSLRSHAYKFLYDRLLNIVLLILHEKSLIIRSDYIRTMFYTRWMTDSLSSIYRVSYSRVMIGLLLALLLMS